MGEDLGSLSSKELESLEKQIDLSLKQIRSDRVNCSSYQAYIILVKNTEPQGTPRLLAFLFAKSKLINIFNL